ncbi:MAG: hypothetical protein MRK02_05370 [Candidatus Scalindua sp.]|nr:hypothetical protein [Candidatus Scalindua sp.]
MMKNISKCINGNRKENEPVSSHKKIRRFKSKTKKKRICLRCEKQFVSEGPYNRICDKCRLANERIATSVYSINGPSAEIKNFVEKELHKLN